MAEDTTEKRLDILTTGMVVADVIAADLPRFASPGEMMFVPRGIEVHVGGHPANVAMDLAAVGMPPDSIGVAAAVGRDVFGEMIERSLVERGIRPLLQRSDVGTSKNMILVLSGEDRRFHLDPGANLELGADWVVDAIRAHRPRVLCCRPGYSGIDLEMERVARAAQDVGCAVFLDVCRPYGKPWDYLAPALGHATFFHGNDGEAMAVTGTRSVEDAMEALLGHGLNAVFITGGESGARVRTGGWDLAQPGLAVDAVDPTGAGDAFCAGVVRTLLDKDELDCDALGQDELARLLAYAQAMGAAAASAVGTTAGVTAERVRSLVEAQGERLVTETRTQE